MTGYSSQEDGQNPAYRPSGILIRLKECRIRASAQPNIFDYHWQSWGGLAKCMECQKQNDRITGAFPAGAAMKAHGKRSRSNCATGTAVTRLGLVLRQSPRTVRNAGIS